MEIIEFFRGPIKQKELAPIDVVSTKKDDKKKPTFLDEDNKHPIKIEGETKGTTKINTGIYKYGKRYQFFNRLAEVMNNQLQPTSTALVSRIRLRDIEGLDTAFEIQTLKNREIEYKKEIDNLLNKINEQAAIYNENEISFLAEMAEHKIRNEEYNKLIKELNNRRSKSWETKQLIQQLKEEQNKNTLQLALKAQENDISKTRVRYLEAQLEHMRNEKDKLSMELSESKNEVEQLREEINNINNQLSMVIEDKAQFEHKFKEYETKYYQLENQLSEAEIESDAGDKTYLDQLEEMKENMDDMKEKIEEKDIEINNLIEERKELQNLITKLKREKTILVDNNKIISQDLTKSLIENVNNKLTVSKLQEDLQKERELNQLRSEAEKRGQSIDQSFYDKKIQELENINRNTAEYKQKYEILETELNKEKLEKQSIQNRLDEIMVLVRKLEQENLQRLNESYENINLKKEKDKLLKELGDIKKDIPNDESELNKRVDDVIEETKEISQTNKNKYMSYLENVRGKLITLATDLKPKKEEDTEKIGKFKKFIQKITDYFKKSELDETKVIKIENLSNYIKKELKDEESLDSINQKLSNIIDKKSKKGEYIAITVEGSSSIGKKNDSSFWSSIDEITNSLNTSKAESDIPASKEVLTKSKRKGSTKKR